MRSFIWVLVMVAAIGCGGDDDSGADPTTLTCEQIAERLQALAPNVSRACAGASDCMPVGYPQRDDGSWTCNCGASFLTQGISVNRVAWESNAEIAPFYAEWNQRCGGGTVGICDYAPGETTCEAQVCRTADFNCFGG